jgi:hypothetical protein
VKKDQTSTRDKRSLMDENPEISNNPVLLMVYIHSDLDGYDIDKLNKDYFSWARTELQNISNRNIDMILITKSTSPEMANFDYKNVSSAYSLDRWSQLVDKTSLRIPAAQSYHPELIKHLLLTRDLINSKVAGIAYNKGQFGISSINDYMTPAHEIAHMFGATHEDAEVIYNRWPHTPVIPALAIGHLFGAVDEDTEIFYNGWWYNTIMNDGKNTAFKGNAYRFSDKNRENIRKYLSQYD